MSFHSSHLISLRPTINLQKEGRKCHLYQKNFEQAWEHLYARDSSTSIASCFSVTGGFDNKSTQKL